MKKDSGEDLQLAVGTGVLSGLVMFTGRDFDSWHKRFELVCQGQKLTDDEKKRALLLALEPHVWKEVISLKWDELTFKKLVERLKIRFRQTRDPSSEMMKLLNIRMEHEVTHQEFASKIYQLALQSFEKDIDERMLVGMFINGLVDPHLQQHLQRENPGDIWDAATIADRWETNHLARLPGN
ncbi:hypothetical protein RF11_00753 [Thelohanellus kitauei]|uniref:Retrotransposon gag domain-containing protein n=1 Tax=Thelohanellus kitauei TaxID=669202 RepID=A0A0C2JNA7_THEKT|nr:hypothetical protein RF11_00753 [Thelohanellus kitauei]